MAQINGRNTVVWNERLKLDVEYVHNCTFVNDVKIILKTIKKVIKKEDILVGKEHTMENLDIERIKIINADKKVGEKGYKIV